MIRNKRKGDHISDDNTALGTTTITYSTNINNWLLKLLLVFDQIKRFRISYTPGELRLAKDLKELNGIVFENGEIELTDDPASIIIRYNDEMTLYKPSVFSIQVPRYYPHTHPTVRCLQEQYILPCCPYFQANGQIIHPDLIENWDALKSTINVIAIITNIRANYDINYTPKVNSNADTMDTDMTNDNSDNKYKDRISIVEDNTTDDDEMSV